MHEMLVQSSCIVGGWASVAISYTLQNIHLELYVFLFSDIRDQSVLLLKYHFMVVDLGQENQCMQVCKQRA